MKRKANECFFFFFALQFHAQVWFDNGKDDKGNLNFFKIQEEAEKYFITIDRTEKGKGYKPYKRWEEHWRHRVFEDGSFPDAGINQNNFETFLKENKNNLKNGILYLKGGDLTEEMKPVKQPITYFELQKIFDEDFFETKKVVYLKMNN